MPSMLKQNSDRYWKKRWKRPRRCRCWPSASVHFVVGDVVQLIVHVADGVEVDARGDERHHAEHRHGQRVDVVADRESQLAEHAERIPIAGDVRMFGALCVRRARHRAAASVCMHRQWNGAVQQRRARARLLLGMVARCSGCVGSQMSKHCVMLMQAADDDRARSRCNPRTSACCTARVCRASAGPNSRCRSS